MFLVFKNINISAYNISMIEKCPCTADVPNLIPIHCPQNLRHKRSSKALRQGTTQGMHTLDKVRSNLEYINFIKYYKFGHTNICHTHVYHQIWSQILIQATKRSTFQAFKRRIQQNIMQQYKILIQSAIAKMKLIYISSFFSAKKSETNISISFWCQHLPTQCHGHNFTFNFPKNRKTKNRGQNDVVFRFNFGKGHRNWNRHLSTKVVTMSGGVSQLDVSVPWAHVHLQKLCTN